MSSENIIKTCIREIDISFFSEIYFHPMVRDLAGKTQLSFVDTEYLGGRHSRLEHSVVVFHFTEELTNKLFEKDMITAQQKIDLKASALLHDLGHPPFSHALEFILGSLIDENNPLKHNTQSVNYIKESESLKKAIGSSGANIDSVCSIIEKKHPDSKIISHNTLGTDKIGYTLLDLHHIGYRFVPSLPFFLDLFPLYVYHNEILGIREEKTEEVMDMQNILQKMYTSVYLTPEITKYKRVIQKAVEYHVKEDNIPPNEMWNLGEGTLLYLLGKSSEPTVKNLLTRFNTLNSYECAMSMKIEGFRDVKSKLHIPVVEVEPSMLEKIKQQAPLSITRIENKIAGEIGLNPEDVIISVSSDPYRIIPEDVILFNQDVENKKKLFEQYPGHYKSLRERAMAAFTIQVNTSPKYVSKLQRKTEYISETILKLAK